MPYLQTYYRLTPFLSPEAMRDWGILVPGYRIDEAAFLATRLRWRVGHEEPSHLCPARREETGELLRALVTMLAAQNKSLSRTFVNLGSGACESPDPLFDLLTSPAGAGFVGLAVDANVTMLQRCPHALASSGTRVAIQHLVVHPLTVVEKLRPQIAALFPQLPPPWPLDVLVVDLDGCDCPVVQEVLTVLRPKVVVLEIAFHIPPPFRFSKVCSNADLDELKYPDGFQAATGCSLSYALHILRGYNLHLWRLSSQDALFVHGSLGRTARKAGVPLPQDEFICFRRSRLWMQYPADFVRDWFFASHPARALPLLWANITASALAGAAKPGDSMFALDY